MTTDIFVPTTNPGDFTNLWLVRKLQGIQNNGPGMSAGLKFDLAAGVSDDIAGTLQQQGIPSFSQPNALGEMLHRAAQDQAGLTPVADLAQYQTRLQQLGYLSPGYTPSGQYDSQTSGATFRYGSDIGNLYRQGQGGFLKATATQGLNFLNSTLPSGIFKAFVGMGKSLWGTLKDIGGAFTGNFSGIKAHLGEDLFNILSTAAMFTGVGEIADAARAGAAALGAVGEDVGANIIEKYGADIAGKGLFQAGQNIAPEELGLVSRAVVKLTGSQDWATEWLTRWSPKALNANQPGFKIMGSILGGASKATAAPRFVAAFDPNTTLGKNINHAAKLPFWVDLPAFVIHPVGGTIPTKEFAKLLHVHEVGWESPYKILGLTDPTDDIRRYHSIQFKVDSDAAKALAPKMSELEGRGGLAVSQAMSAARADVLAGARDETGRISQKFTNDAVTFATQHPKGVAATILNGLGDAKARVSEGFQGSQDFGDYTGAERVTKDITRRWVLAPQGFDGQVIAMRADNPATKQNIQRLLTIWRSGDEVAKDGVRGELNVLFNQNVPADRLIGKELEEALPHAPVDLTDSQGIYQPEKDQLRNLGFKPAHAGNDVLLHSDTTDLLSSPTYAKHQYMASFLNKSAPEDMRRLTQATLKQSWNDILNAKDSQMFPYGTGDAVAASITKTIREEQTALEKIARAGTSGDKFRARFTSKFLTLQDYPPQKIAQALQDDFGATTEQAQSLAYDLHKAGLKSYTAAGLPTGPSEQYRILDQFRQALRLHGLPGISETIRAMTLPKWTGKAAFLPERLLKGAMALRFSMNPLYNARVFGKQQILAGASEDLSPMVRPWHWLNAEPGRMDEAMQLSKSLGRNYIASDDLERAMRSEGYLMNNIGHLDTANDLRVYKREIALNVHKGMEQADAESQALNYVRDNRTHWTATAGARAPWERSMNYVFFPFSFEKKLLGTMSDYLTQEPVRVFLAHETMRRVQSMEKVIGLTAPDGIPDAKAYDARKKLSAILQKYAPILNEVNKLNAFAGGISLGEPITQGGLGPEAVLGTVYKPLADALGHPVQTISSLFHPVMIQSKDQVRWQGVAPRLIPALNAFSDFFYDTTQQAHAIAGQGTTQSQIDDYFTLERALADHFAQLGQAFGTNGTINSFEQSTAIPDFLKAQYMTEKTELIQRYPAGARLSASFASGNTDLMKLQILGNVNRSRAEQGVVALEALFLQLSQSPLMNAPGGTVIGQNLLTIGMRDEGLRLFGTLKGKDRQDFITLWRRLGYQHSYGPIAVSTVGEEVA